MTRSAVLALLWCLAVLAACSVPGEHLPRGPIWSFDKVIHILMFIPIGALWLRAAPERAVSILLGAAAFAVGIEVWQQLPFVGRTMDLVDAAADVVGAVLGMGIERVWSRHREQRSGA